MLTKAQIIWSLIGAATGTTAFQAYQHRQDLLRAAEAELPIAIADSLEALVPPDSSLIEWDDKEPGLKEKLAGYLDSMRSALTESNAKSCEGYCDVRRDKCVKMANRDADLVRICQDERNLCFTGCHADESTAAKGSNPTWPD